MSTYQSESGNSSTSPLNLETDVLEAVAHEQLGQLGMLLLKE
ncbi:hypothetical protein [Nostoc sp. 'Peltigera malacea cyanobiont' DB3992]|nr:hypothetical protein [Nostoc sp. 'Peltigera malacea cyanobiont' DB3992]